MSIGICIANVNFLLQFYDGSDGKCIAQDVLFHIGFSVTFGSLIIKTWRLSKIFNSGANQSRGISVKNSNLYKIFFGQLFLIVIYLLVSKLVADSNVAVENSIVISDHDVHDVQQVHYCGNTKWHFAISLVELIVIAVGAWLAYQTSKLPRYFLHS
jgi:hypothetical protein